MASVAPILGQVISFDEEAGLGVVRAPDGREWAFHCTQIADGTRSVTAGTAVVFEVVPGGPGRWEAATLVKVS